MTTTNKEAVLTAALEPFARLCPDGVPALVGGESLVKHVNLKDVLRAQKAIAMVAATPSVPEKDCYCGGWDDVHQSGCPEVATPSVQGESIDTPEFRELVQNVRHGLMAQTWPLLIAHIEAWHRARLARTAAPSGITPEQYAAGDALRAKFVTAPIADPDFPAAPSDFKLMSPSEILAEQKKMIDAGTYDVVRLAQYVEARTLKASQAAPSEQERRYATQIATALWEAHYKADAPQWRVLNDLYGALSQIDNMTYGLTRKVAPAAPSEGLAIPETVYDQLARDLLGTGISVTRIAPEDFFAPATEQAKPELDRLAHRESLWVALLDAANAYLAADPEQGIMIGLHDKQTFLGLGTKAQFTSMCDGRSGLQREEERHDRVRLIELLEQIKPNYGDVGSRDCEVTAQRKRIEDAIVILSAQPAPQASGERDVLEMELALYRNAYGTKMPSEAMIDVLDERRRQAEEEGWTAEGDDRYISCELAVAAATYAVCERPEQMKVCGITPWPWPLHWWKPTTYRRNLVKAGALIIAEIERIDRKDESSAATTSTPKGEAA